MENAEPVRIEQVAGKVCFDHVSFHKADMYEILHDISFTVEAGRTLGIMGATGAGKTSIVQLLQRMYDAAEGEDKKILERILRKYGACKLEL